MLSSIARVLVLSTVVLNGNGPAAVAKGPNILFLLADDMRPDCIAALGNRVIQTPNLDRLVSRGLTFSRATCSNPICVVSRAEMLTGMHGWENGITGIRGATLREDITFWGDALRGAGYQTWYVGKWHTSGRPTARGYDKVAGLYSGGGGKFWKDQTDWKGFPVTGYRGWIFQSADGKTKYPEEGVGLTPDISSKFADAAISLIASDDAEDKPWFCHINFTAPHDPLFMPPGLEGRYSAAKVPFPNNFLPEHPFDHGNLRGRDEELLRWPRTEAAVRDLLRVYYSVIDDLDAQIGRILKSLEESGQLDNTIVIFTSDHGMGCGSHGLRGKQSQYEHTINVPFVMAGPGIPQNQKTSAQIYLRELYPTTCELVGAASPDTVTATSFAGVVRGKTDKHHDHIFGYYTDTQRMIRSADGWKLIQYPQIDRWQMFNVNMDPNELTDVHDDASLASVRRGLAERLQKWRIVQGDPLLRP